MLTSFVTKRNLQQTSHDDNPRRQPNPAKWMINPRRQPNLARRTTNPCRQPNPGGTDDNHMSTTRYKTISFEHHENHVGNGYPQSLKGGDIHPMARIVALTDTYDALTTKRSYNVPMTPQDALTMMKDKLAGRFNPDLLKAMYSVLFKFT